MGLAGKLGLVLAQRGREFGELGQAPVYGAGKCAFVDFVVVARVQGDHFTAFVVMALLQPAAQRGRRDRGGAPAGGADGGVVHANDLALDLDQHLAKRHMVGPAFLGVQIGKARVQLELSDEAANGHSRPGQEEVDAFLGQQHRTLEVQFLGARQQRLAQCVGVGQGREFVAGDVEYVGHVDIRGGDHSAARPTVAELRPGPSAQP